LAWSTSTETCGDEGVILAPLTKLVGANPKNKFQWEPEQQTAFDEIKKAMSRETLLSFPDFTKEFHVHADASDYQLGAVIMQEGQPLAFYSRKLNDAQKNYTTGEQELLSIVETLKAFRNILLGQKVTVYTDHKNILYDCDLSNSHLARWRHILEEYGQEYKHISGKENVVADALSRMDTGTAMMESLDLEPLDVRSQVAACTLAQLTRNEANLPSLTRENNWEFIHEHLMASNETLSKKFPMSPALISKYQNRDKELQKRVKNNPTNYGTKEVENVTLTTSYEHKNAITLPKVLQNRIVVWYHEYLVHPGGTRLEKTLTQLLWDNLP